MSIKIVFYCSTPRKEIRILVNLAQKRLRYSDVDSYNIFSQTYVSASTGLLRSGGVAVDTSATILHTDAARKPAGMTRVSFVFLLNL